MAVVLFSICCSSKSGGKVGDPNVVAVSFKEAFSNSNDVRSPFSAHFKISKGDWQPAAVTIDSTYSHLAQKYCLDGKTEALPDQPRYSLILCFEINEPVPYKMMADPLNPGTFPIGQLEPGKLYSMEMYKLTGVGLSVNEEGSPPGDERRTHLINSEAQGSLQITASEKKRIAGKINVSDLNMSVVGEFDCPVH